MLSKIQFKFRKLFSGKVAGNFASIFSGGGLEVENFRRYEPWDDIKRINWKLSAKHRELYITLFREEKDVDVHIFLDINYNWKTFQDDIYSYLTNVCILARKSGANSSISYFDKKLKSSRPTKNMSYIYGEMKATYNSVNKQPAHYVSHIKDFINREKAFNKRHIIVIFSDFFAVEESDIKWLKALKEKNELVFINIPLLDSLENMGKGQLLNGFFSKISSQTMLTNYKGILHKLWKIGRMFNV